MENENTFGFLSEELSQKYFARLDFALKSGRHIQNSESERTLFNYCDTFYDELRHYYETLYQVQFECSSSQLGKYYFLDFAEDHSGKFTGDQKPDTLDEMAVIFGILLLNMEHEEVVKVSHIFSVEEVLDYIFDKEHKENFLRLLTRADESSFYGKDNAELQTKLRSALNKFEKLGWIRWVNKTSEQTFEVMPSLERLYLLYKYEIDHVDKFLEEL
jgi:chromosome condensin MukBEF MukE localization factor